MRRRWRLIGVAGLVILGLSRPVSAADDDAKSSTVKDLPEARRWLDDKSHELIRACRRKMNDGSPAFPPQAGKGYEAFWLRDYAYMLEGCSEAFSDDELRSSCRLFVKSLRADGAAVDCVRFDGTPIYQPGYGTLGKNPVADGSMFMIDVAWHTHQRLKDKQFLEEIIDRLAAAMQAVPRNSQTGLVQIKPAGYDRCPYGFTDSVRKQGDELFCSLLLVQANRQMAELLKALDRNDEAEKLLADEQQLIQKIRETFWDEKTGLFLAATLQCRQPDIWGSAFAVYLNVATKEQSLRIAQYFDKHYTDIVQQGQLRHLPGGMYWEAACPQDTYQNGGYWGTPIGWFIVTLDLVNPKLADQTVIDMVNDYRERGVNEWVLGNHTVVPNYVDSATLPLAGLKRLQRQRSDR